MTISSIGKLNLATILALILVFSAAVTLAGPASAADEGTCGEGTKWNRKLRACVQDTKHGGGLPPSDETTIPVVKARNGEPPRCFEDAGGQRQEIPCVRNDGSYWNGTCYVKHITDPPKGRQADFKAAMKGHDGEGAVISCYYPLCDNPADFRNDPDAYLLQCPAYNWAPDAEPVDPAQVAGEIWARLRKAPIDIGVAPFDKDGYVGAVGIPTWYWVEDPSTLTTGPLEDSDSSRGFTVVADTVVDHIEWDLGNGRDPLICPPDSTAFDVDRHTGESPDCGYTFEEQGTYTITATAVWHETWAGLGQAGTREFPLDTETEIVIGEIQVLNQ